MFFGRFVSFFKYNKIEIITFDVFKTHEEVAYLL